MQDATCIPQAARAPAPVACQVTAFDAVTSDLIYEVNLGEIVSVSTGNVSWMSADSALQPDSAPPSIGAVAGTNVIFVSGSTVLAQGY
jgi:hypothetical protein